MNLKQALTNATAGMERFRSRTSVSSSAMSQLKGSVNSGASAVGRLRGGLTNAETTLGRSKGATDRFKASLDKLKSSADKAKGALKDVKQQSDAVEKSVGKAGKNADKGGKSMGSLGKGLKGASTAQKGLNLAMASNPFGLVMTLVAPLIAQFVNMDKVAALVRKGLTAAWSHIKSSSQSAAKIIGPLFKGVVNGFLTPTRMLVRGLNVLIGALNRVKFKVPDWVPGIGGRGFAFNLSPIPVPQLAKGGVVRARTGGTLALVGEGGEHEAVIPLSKLERMLGSGGGMRRLAAAVEALAERPVQIDVDSQTIARAVQLGQRKLARR
ncbi:prefoldin subunit 5 [Streptomyces umbrinus]|uniref:Prefoldin subunit 5 n=2 Tax=Streptomyces umbrinus TaxID=67370 RepID=A0ABU0SX52_9ACTN|nr:prefoldin subunit 5 [Streptomyces umbrinus]